VGLLDTARGVCGNCAEAGADRPQEPSSETATHARFSRYFLGPVGTSCGRVCPVTPEVAGSSPVGPAIPSTQATPRGWLSCSCRIGFTFSRASPRPDTTWATRTTSTIASVGTTRDGRRPTKAAALGDWCTRRRAGPVRLLLLASARLRLERAGHSSRLSVRVHRSARTVRAPARTGRGFQSRPESAGSPPGSDRPRQQSHSSHSHGWPLFFASRRQALP